MTRKNLDIQALRGVAILMVFAHHLLHLIPNDGFYVFVRAKLLLSTGVELFLAISGFVIMRSLLGGGGSEEKGFGVARFGSFWRRRFYRLLPASLLWMGIGLVVLPLSGLPWTAVGENARALLFALTGTFNLLNAYCVSYHAFGTVCPSNQITYVYWSLSLEEQFYLLLSCGLLFAMPRTVLSGGLAVLFGFVTYGTARGTLYLDSTALNVVYDVVSRSYALFFGSLLATCDQGRVTRVVTMLPSAVRYAALLLGAFALALLGRSASPFVGTCGVSLVAALMVALALPDATVSRGLPGRMLVWIGERSYSFYLCHVTVLFAVGRFMVFLMGESVLVTPSTPLMAIGLALSLAVSLLFADFTYRLVETPFIDLGRRRSSRLPQAA